LGIIDGFSPKGIEGDADIAHRKEFLRMIGYKNRETDRMQVKEYLREVTE
jgi:hypothetical protein